MNAPRSAPRRQAACASRRSNARRRQPARRHFRRLDHVPGRHRRRRDSCAARPGRVATVAVNAFQFKQSVQIGDLLSFYADIVRVGTTSITVNVEVYAQRRPSDIETVKVTRRRSPMSPPGRIGGRGSSRRRHDCDSRRGLHLRAAAPKTDHGRARALRARRVRARGDRPRRRLGGIRAAARRARPVDRRLRLPVRAAAGGGDRSSLARRLGRARRPLRDARPGAFRAALDTYRASRAVGNKYPHRATDLPAGSHSPIKLVNPPVALMFLEGAPRLARAGVTIPGLAAAIRSGSRSRRIPVSRRGRSLAPRTRRTKRESRRRSGGRYAPRSSRG